MALNLLDSLNASTAAPEKNSFSLKNNGETESTTAVFGQMLQNLMDPMGLKNPGGEKSGEDKASDDDSSSGQELATTGTDLTPANGDALGAALLITPPPVPVNLTAWVLSPNMTAITTVQPLPSSGSLAAFAKAQGLDEDVAAWLMNAGKSTPSDTGVSSKTLPLPEVAKPLNAPDAVGTLQPEVANIPFIANMVAATTTMSSAALPKMVGETAALPETTPVSSPIAFTAMTTPAAWLTSRVTMPAKVSASVQGPTASKSDSAVVHDSDLDLTLVFGQSSEASKSLRAVEAPFTPAAWAMAAAMTSTGTSSPAAIAPSMLKLLVDDKKIEASDENGNAVGNNGTERLSPPPRTAENTINTTKGFENTLSNYERTEQQHAQAEKMAQAIGQRMLSEMEKGHWHLKMMLRPANLGHIEVEMRLRNGELDASFTAPQALTRDLLQDGLPRLRETLSQMGMDVANMNIGGGSSQKNGGDPTPQQAQTLTTAAQTEQKEEPAIIQKLPVTPSGQDGLDVLV